MITDMDLVLPVAIVAAAALVAFAIGYLAGARRTSQPRRPAEDDLGIVRAVTTRRGRARQTRPTTIPRRTDGHQ